MKKSDLVALVQQLVRDATVLKDAWTDQKDVSVGYACVFAQSKKEYELLRSVAQEWGDVIKTTPTGNLYKIPPLATVSGNLQVLKIRKPDVTRQERGDADFNLSNYENFKQKKLHEPGFRLILRDTFEMIELLKAGEKVRVYFSNPPVEQQLGLS